ncbi:uncharacterized protein [Battus philenor]|uniref:uncharacterized protein isoform X2 n=1 Tax=Battus philenor TaxID=42288 RepID=UPI0035CFFFE5
MRLTLILVASFAALAAAEFEDPWVEEEELEEPYNEEDYRRERRRREVDEEADCDVPERVRRSSEPDYVRRPRQVHQYEVHEFSEDAAQPSVPYEEMLAASAEHYHRVHPAPGSKSSRHLHADTIKGFKTDQYVDKGGKGFKKDENHRKEYEEAAGKKTKHHDHAGHKGGHEEEAHGHRGSNFEEKKGHKKGHKTKGYHNKYHKDEFHKEHKFYDDFHKSGEHHRYGKFNAKHASNESGKKKAHHVNAGHDFVERGKKGYSNKGHVDADHQGYDGKDGHEEHNESHSQYGKKGGKAGGSHWGHAKKN